jgi:pyruvate dehydrogenase E2 component (dihydrolipoamide acetyltransferase)
MPKDIVMPKASLTMTEGTLLEWIKKDGEEVKKGEEIAQIETDKVVLPIEADCNGTLVHVINEGQLVPVATIIGYILNAGESRDCIGNALQNTLTAKTESGEEFSESKNEIPLKEDGIKITPLARQTAKVLGVEISEILASGLFGKISVEDVKAIASKKEGQKDQPLAAPQKTTQFDGESKFIPFSGVRGLIADRMAFSAHSTASVTLHTRADCSSLLKVRSSLNEHMNDLGIPKTSFDSIIVKAVALSLQNHRRVNSRILENQIEELGPINVAVAVDTPRDLCTVVIRDANKKSLIEISKELNDLVHRALDGKLRVDDINDSTFTITNLGMFNVLDFTPIIQPNQCAILGIGAIVDTLTLQEERVMQKKELPLSLTFDHRMIDGAPAAKFLNEVCSRLGSAELLLL